MPPAKRQPRDRRINVAAGIVGLVIAAVVVLLIVLPTTAPRHAANIPHPQTVPVSHAPEIDGLRLFAANSVWNEPLSPDAALAPDSGALVRTLLSQFERDGQTINTTQYSVPVYTVSRDQPTVPVKLEDTGPGVVRELAATFAAGVPIPAGATPAPGTDQHMVILQPSTGTMWEFWHMQDIDGSWRARWGGKMMDVSSNPGSFVDPPEWGATASSIPLLAGLMLTAELRAGTIDHALALAIPEASRRHVLPAQRSDGTSTNASAIPEGTHFRIAANVDLQSLHLSPVALIMARAAQRYGVIVRDQSTTLTFYAQQPTPLSDNEYAGAHGIFDGQDPQHLLAGFPWRDLEVVAPPSALAAG
jgi:hypothetical protein